MSHYDVIVIGAGNAGLTAATALQRGGAKTLLLERHNVPGGCATSFVRGRYEFEVALHQLSGVGTESNPFAMRDLFRKLGIADKIELVEEHDLYRVVLPGRVDLVLPADRARLVATLEDRFPGSRASVDAFLALCYEVCIHKYMAIPRWSKPGGPEAVKAMSPKLMQYAFRTAKQVLDEFFSDPELKFVLGAYWGYAGLPPSRLNFSDLAELLFVYIEYRPFHIRGGSQAMSSALLASFHEAGGDSRFNCGAERILTRNGAAVGVLTAAGETFHSTAVVSNASTITTFVDLLGPEHVPAPILDDMRSRRIGISGFVLYMGLDATPEALGLTTSTNFVTSTIDEDEQHASAYSLSGAKGICASCYDVAPIGFAPTGASHVSLITVQYAEPWQKLDPADYARAKFTYAQSLIGLLEHISPNVRDVIEEVDVATPLTMMRYLGHPGGAIYGFQQDRAAGWPLRNAQSHVPGLYLAGSWAGPGGFQPTLDAGARTARRILRDLASATENTHV